MLIWAVSELARMEEIFPVDPGNEVTGAGLKVNQRFGAHRFGDVDGGLNRDAR